MSLNWSDDDDVLAEELALALHEGPPSPDRVAMIMTAYDIANLDTLEAALTHDSATGELAAVRSEDAGARLLTYTTDESVEFDFEIVDGRIVGHVAPPAGGAIHLDQPFGPSAVPEVEIDDLGGFEFVLGSSSAFRLRYVDGQGRSVATGWLDGPHPTG